MPKCLYKEAMWQHLADYKKSTLVVKDDGIWRRTGKTYPHILPFGYQHLNILEPYREDFWRFFRNSTITLHSDFHHLSSSQAMCFNLFYPFLAEEKRHLHILGTVFSINEAIEDAEFECVADPVEGTNFDFCITSKSRKFFELKLTEEQFGTAKADKPHLTKFQEIYLPMMEGKFKSGFASCEVFLKHYQLMRNVWSLGINTSDSFACIVPRANDRLAERISFLGECLSEPYRERVKVYYLEDFVVTLEKSIPRDLHRMTENLRLFREKYLPDVPIQSAH
jgi:Restriction Endonuclease associating with ARP